ncbi:MAG: hypothetical protein ACYTGB_17430 [Planctomycetota bacterium]|jgi:hypothetical protein
MANDRVGFRLDRIYDLDPLTIQAATLRIMSVWQKEKAAIVVASSAAMFLEVCRRYEVEPRNVLDASARVLRNSREKRPVEWRALRRFMKERLGDA